MSIDLTIQLDRKHRALRNDDNWVITRLQPDGTYDLIDAWQGPRRSIYRHLDALNIHPSRAAEQQLNTLPERRSFKEDEPRAP